MAAWRINTNYFKWARITIILLLVIFLLYFFYLLRGIFLSLLLAVVLTYLLLPPVRFLEARGMSRTSAIFIVYCGMFILLAGLVLYGMPHIIEQLYLLAELVPGYTIQVRELTASLQLEYARAGIPEAVRQIIDERIVRVEQMLVQMAEKVVQIIIGLAGYIFNLILAPIFAYYMLKDVEMFTERLALLIPARWREDVQHLGCEVSRVVDRFIRGYLLVSVIIGAVTSVLLAVLDMEFALMLGIFAGITNLIPYFGPFIGAIPAVGLALLVSKWLAIKVIIAYILIQQLEASIISPKVLGDRVGLHPLLIILVLLASGQLFGLSGLILAVPVAAVLRVLFIFALNRLWPHYNT